MPFLFKDYIRPIVWHGGEKNLDLMDKLTLRLELQFPHTVNSDDTVNVSNLTISLMDDLEIDMNNQVYAVNWGDNAPDQNTVSQDYNPAKHIHTYIGGGDNQNSSWKYFTVDCYGYNFSKYYTIDRRVGSGENSYRIYCREVSRRARRKILQD